MKKSFLLIVLLIPVITGCKQLNWVGDKLFEPVIEEEITHTNKVVKIPEVVLLPDGNLQTNLVDQLQPVKLITTHTNGWKLRSGIEKTIHLAGDVAPFPWAPLAANAVISTLGALAFFRGRKWKKATYSSVQAADKWRTVVKLLDPDTDNQIKADVIKEQRSSGTLDLVASVVKKVLK